MRFSDILLAISVGALWGGNFVAAKLGLQELPPFFLTGLRFVMVALMMVPFLHIPKREIVPRLLFFACLGTMHFSFGYIGLASGLSVATVVITTQLSVPFACLLGFLFFKDTIGPWRIFGMAIAFGGLLLLVGTPEVKGNLYGFCFVLAGAFIWASSNVSVKIMHEIDPFALIGWMSLLCAPQLLLLSWIFEGGAAPWRALTHVSPTTVWATLYTAIGSTMLGHGLWCWLLKRHPVSQVAPFSLLVPPFGIAFAQFFFEETLPAMAWIGGGITLLGVAIILFRRPKTLVMAEAT